MNPFLQLRDLRLRQPLPPAWYAYVASVKRSHRTHCPAASAGRRTLARCSVRAANISRVSVSAVIGWFSTSSRTDSPSGVPPGSRVRMTSMPRARSAVAMASMWVLLPAPSIPSNVISRPRAGAAPITGCPAGTCRPLDCVQPAWRRNARFHRRAKRNTAHRSLRAAALPRSTAGQAMQSGSEAGRRACRSCTAHRRANPACASCRRTRAQPIDHRWVGLQQHTEPQPINEHARNHRALRWLPGLLLDDRRHNQRLVWGFVRNPFVAPLP